MASGHTRTEALEAAGLNGARPEARRIKLTGKEYEVYRQAQAGVVAAQAALQQAQQKIGQWAELVFDHHGLPQETAAHVDDTTQELVIPGVAPAASEPAAEQGPRDPDPAPRAYPKRRP